MLRRRVVVFAPYFHPGFRAGGALRSIVQITDTAPPGFDTLVITADHDLGQQPYPGLSGQEIARGRAKVLYIDPRSLANWWRVIRRVRFFKPHFYYLNSLWNRGFALMPALLIRARVLPPARVLLAPRGQLADGALGTGHRLKRLLLPWWRLWARGWLIHCTDDREVSQVRRHLSKARCVVSMDPVNLPAKPFPWVPGDLDAGLRVIVVGRVSPVKNLAPLLRGLRDIEARVSMRIVGPTDQSEYLDEIQALAATLPDNVTVEFHGAIPAEEVCRQFAASDLFAFPTLGENFGHVIAEALSASCPVAVGPVTPFTNTVREGGGVILDHTDPSAWTRVITEWAARNQTELSQAHEQAGRAYVEWLRLRDDTHIFDEVAAGNWEGA